MTNIDLETYDEIPGCDWIVSLEGDVPQRLVKIEFDTATLIALVDVADAATFAGGERTRDNAAILRDYFLKVINQLERRSLHDHEQWQATKHLEAVDA
jgi:hypothetical protein